MRTDTLTRRETTVRLDYLDAVRAFALLLGIVFHASLSFVPVFIGWAVMDVSTSPWVSTFALVSHAFRMELFFLIAGFFSCMTLTRRGLGAFVRSRAVRIGLPFVLGWFVLRPLIVGAWIMGAESLRGDVDVVGGLVAGFQSLATLPASLLVGTHLWFLYYLLLITTIVVAVRAVLTRLPGVGPDPERIGRQLAGWLAHSRLALPALMAPTAVLLWFMQGWGMDTPDRSLVPHWPVLGIYTLCFALGWVLRSEATAMALFTRLTPARWLLATVSIGACLVLAPHQQDAGHPSYAALRGLFVLGYAGMMWSLVVLTIGLFKRFLDRPKATVRYLADASYWLYLAHLPIVLWLQIAVAELPGSWALKWAGVCVITVGVGLLLYDLFVRSTVIGRVLNGSRKLRSLTPGFRLRRLAP